jgi:hypothetical protein
MARSEDNARTIALAANNLEYCASIGKPSHDVTSMCMAPALHSWSNALAFV